MAMLEPKFAVLDETDSGLDVDALKVVSEGVNTMRGPDLGVLIITHYTRILRLHPPGRGARDVRGAHRADRRARSWPTTWRSTATWSSAPPRRPPRRRALSPWARPPPSTRGAAGRLPDPGADGPRRAAGLPRLGGHLAEAGRGARRDGRVLPRDQRQRAPRRVRAGGRGDGALRGRPRRRGRAWWARRARAVVFTKNASEAINLVAWAWGVRDADAPATRCSSPRWSTTRTSCPGRSSPPDHRRDRALLPGDGRGRARPGRLPRACSRSAPAWSPSCT